MEYSELIRILKLLKENDELPFVEAKDSLQDAGYIGKTISALSNSASYHDQKYGYLIWVLKTEHGIQLAQNLI